MAEWEDWLRPIADAASTRDASTIAFCYLYGLDDHREWCSVSSASGCERAPPLAEREVSECVTVIQSQRMSIDAVSCNSAAATSTTARTTAATTVTTGTRANFCAVLPDDLCSMILGLCSFSDVCHASCVSREWRRLAQSNSTWKLLWLRAFSSPPPRKHDCSPNTLRFVFRDLFRAKKECLRFELLGTVFVLANRPDSNCVVALSSPALSTRPSTLQRVYTELQQPLQFFPSLRPKQVQWSTVACVVAGAKYQCLLVVVFERLHDAVRANERRVLDTLLRSADRLAAVT
eukprot:gnl/Spiro4/136_TR74_c0_g1_i1.p2 gnl/Spiro4/136_TR74_c0_g1~~gnl/Spiro4/136_TR74_c0_g1_i1.p2  ORF type:complete len:299 (+),score=86.26 gnl/Spiro4/136_TR74_c0_g1_i1:29-898(+)